MSIYCAIRGVLWAVQMWDLPPAIYLSTELIYLAVGLAWFMPVLSGKGKFKITFLILLNLAVAIFSQVTNNWFDEHQITTIANGIAAMKSPPREMIQIVTAVNYRSIGHQREMANVVPYLLLLDILWLLWLWRSAAVNREKRWDEPSAGADEVKCPNRR